MGLVLGLEDDEVYQRVEPDPALKKRPELEFYLEVPRDGSKRLPNVMVLCSGRGISQLTAELRHGGRLLATLSSNKVTFPGQCRIIKPIWKIRELKDLPLVAPDSPFANPDEKWRIVVRQHDSK